MASLLLVSIAFLAALGQTVRQRSKDVRLQSAAIPLVGGGLLVVVLGLILNGSLAETETVADPIFGVGVPVSCPDVPNEVLQPRNTWEDKDAYDRQAKDLARRFNENFKKYEEGVSEAVRAVAPKA